MKIPRVDIKNIRIYYILNFFLSASFIAGNWIFFWTLFMSYEQLGVVDSIGFAFAMLIQIPSGAIADVIGKKKTVILALLASTVGIFIMSLGISLTNILIGYLVAQLGWTMFSGSAEALAYDSLVDEGCEKDFDKVISFVTAISTIVASITILLGIPLYNISPNFPHIMWGVFNLISLVIAFTLTEPKIRQERFSLKGYFEQMGNGIKQMFSKKLKKYVVIVFCVIGMVYMYQWGLIQPSVAIANNLDDRGQSIIYSIAALLSALIALTVPFLRKRISDYKGLTILGVVTSLIFLLLSLPLGVMIVVPMVLIILIGGVANPWVMTVINVNIPSKYRATTISAMTLVSQLPYVLVAIIAGRMVEQGNLNQFLLAISIIIFIAILSNTVINTLSTKAQPKIY